MIQVDIERAVSCMQSVIELGRLVRDRNTLPLKVIGTCLASFLLARLHEVHRAIVVTSVVCVYVYVYVCVRVTLSVKVF